MLTLKVVVQLVWFENYLTPALTQTRLVIPPAPLSDHVVIVEAMTIRRDLSPRSSGHKNYSSPKMKAAGFSETLVTD